MAQMRARSARKSTAERSRRSRKNRTPFTLVKMSQWYEARLAMA